MMHALFRSFSSSSSSSSLSFFGGSELAFFLSMVFYLPSRRSKGIRVTVAALIVVAVAVLLLLSIKVFDQLSVYVCVEGRILVLTFFKENS